MPGVDFGSFFTLSSSLSGTWRVPHSSTLISVCSDNEHRGAHGLPTERAVERVEQRENVLFFIGDSLCSTFAVMAYLCTTISLQHLASDAWFILNNAAYVSPDVIMRACGLAYVHLP